MTFNISVKNPAPQPVRLSHFYPMQSATEKVPNELWSRIIGFATDCDPVVPEVQSYGTDGLPPHHPQSTAAKIALSSVSWRFKELTREFLYESFTINALNARRRRASLTLLGGKNRGEILRSLLHLTLRIPSSGPSRSFYVFITTLLGESVKLRTLYIHVHGRCTSHLPLVERYLLYLPLSLRSVWWRTTVAEEAQASLFQVLPRIFQKHCLAGDHGHDIRAVVFGEDLDDLYSPPNHLPELGPLQIQHGGETLSQMLAKWRLPQLTELHLSGLDGHVFIGTGVSFPAVSKVFFYTVFPYCVPAGWRRLDEVFPSLAALTYRLDVGVADGHYRNIPMPWIGAPAMPHLARLFIQVVSDVMSLREHDALYDHLLSIPLQLAPRFRSLEVHGARAACRNPSRVLAAVLSFAADVYALDLPITVLYT